MIRLAVLSVTVPEKTKMIDHNAETLLPLQEAATTLPGPPSVNTMRRWHREGLRGVRLETLLVGGRRMTSLEALERFIARTNEAGDTNAN